MSEPEPDITQFALSILGHGHGAIHTVPIGTAAAPVIIIKTLEIEPYKYAIEVSTGAPFDNDVQGVNDLADYLDFVVQTLRQPEFQERWAAKLEAEPVDTDEFLETGDDDGA